MPPNTVKVSRPGVFGNPFIGQGAIAAYRNYLLQGERFRMDPYAGTGLAFLPSIEHRKRVLEELKRLKGKNLACFCAAGKPCHADVLIELANAA